MSLQHKRTPVLRIKQEESPSKSLSNLPNWENFKCESHPQLQVQALGFNKSNKNFALVCIKCIIEGDYFKTGGEDESITIKDLLESYSKTLSAFKRTPMKNKEGLQEKFVNFLIKDYMGTYERHLETQRDRIDQAIDEVIEQLTRVRDKYKQYYNLELEVVRDQTTDMKNKINKLLENTKTQEAASYTSMSEVYDHMAKISEHEELLEFLRDLYHKSKEKTEDANYSDDCRKLLASMESFKEKSLTCKSKEVEMSSFEDIKDTLQHLLQPESSAFRKSIEGFKAFKSVKKDMEVESKREHRDIESKREYRDIEPRRETEMRREIETRREVEPKREFEMRRREPAPKRYTDLDSDYEAEDSDSQIYHSPTVQERTSSAKRRNLDTASTAKKKKREKHTGHTDIGSNSLRNLKKVLEKNEDEDEEDTKDRIITSLHDWINRRITGYLIFQNTLNSDPDMYRDKAGISETGIHLNHSMGRKWKALSEEEREDFKRVALEHRKRFKQEIDDFDDSDKAGSLLEMLDAKIKKLKRE